MTINNLIRKHAGLLLDSFVLLLPIFRKRRGLLLVRMDAIGDFVIWTAAVRKFATICQPHDTVLVANEAWAELAKSMNCWRDVIPVNTKRFSADLIYRLKILFLIRSYSFETAIQPTLARRLSQGDSIIRASRATRRVGFVGDLTIVSASDQAISNRWYTELVPKSKDSATELEQNAVFAATVTRTPVTLDAPDLGLTGADLTRFNLPEKYFVIAPGASWHGRVWSPKGFAEVARSASARLGSGVVFCGSTADSTSAKAIVAELGRLTSLDLTGRTSIPELVELIRGAEFLIGNESSAVHIAAAVKTPSVCIVGGGHYGRFVPYPSNLKECKQFLAHKQMSCYNCNWKCVYPYTDSEAVKCIRDITPFDVLIALNKALETE